jgi:glycosyltransferase involved in cell wall biosynthesis
LTESKKIDVSVIVPALNAEKFIGRCLRSLSSQFAHDFTYEVIVIDDGSQDGTSFIVEQFVSPKSDKFSLLRNYTNEGLPASLNKGIAAARGSKVIRVDADDYVNERYLDLLQAFLCLRPAIHAVSCDYLIVNENEDVIESKSWADARIGCGVMFRKSALQALGGYDVNFLRREDEEMLARFRAQFSIAHLRLPLYRYRRHQTNITNDLEAMEFYKRELKKKLGRSND